MGTAFFFGCGNDSQIQDLPEIYSIVPSSASVGDTVRVNGSGFDREPLNITVAFSPCDFSNSRASRIIRPLQIRSDELTLLVPDGSFTGSVRVELPNPLGMINPFGLNVPAIPSGNLDFSVQPWPGDVSKIFYSSSSYGFCITTAAFEEEYLMILFNSSDPPVSSKTYEYLFSADTPCPVLPAGHLPGGRGDESKQEVTGGDDTDIRARLAHHYGRASGFERRKWDEFREIMISGYGGEENGRDIDNRLKETPSAPQTVDFDVYTDIEGSTVDPSSFTVVTAELKYEGEHTLLYVDQDTDISCITDAEAFNLGEAFDTRIYQTNRSTFGNESDINGDGKVAILLSPVVNLLTPPGTASEEGYIAGFFLPGDLMPSYIHSACTNGMEIFYTIVPDPGPIPIYGNTYEKERALRVIEGVLGHEFLHMIMFNYRILIYGKGFLPTYIAETWLDEGLAHIAEDLNGHDEDNILRANIFLIDPGDVTLVHGGDDLGERGASFLFFRYLGDRFGESIYADLVQSMTTGVANVEKATGMDFYEIFSDWVAALYLDGLEITDDPRFEYSAINLRSDFSQLAVKPAGYCFSAVTGDVKSMGPEYIFLTVPPLGSFDFTIDSEASGRMNAVIIRLK